MRGRMKLYVALLIVAVATVGTGVGLLLTRPHQVKLPDTAPIISTEASYLMGGQDDRLFVYEDGTVIRIWDRNLRISTPGNPPIRTWYTGKLSGTDLEDLKDLVTSKDFADLKYTYSLPPPIQSGGGVRGDLDFTVAVNLAALTKAVQADGFMSSDGGVTYPDMPYPLNQVYARLHAISEKDTREVARQKIAGTS